jgi:hypothetical protein
MSKIVQAVNAMISNQEKISQVMEGDDEYFFVYRDMYKWSIKKTNDDVILYFYPEDYDIESLAALSPSSWNSIRMVIYKASEIGTKEAISSFLDLLTIIKEKQYGVDSVLDDIIGDLDL